MAVIGKMQCENLNKPGLQHICRPSSSMAPDLSQFWLSLGLFVLFAQFYHQPGTYLSPLSTAERFISHHLFLEVPNLLQILITLPKVEFKEWSDITSPVISKQL